MTKKKPPAPGPKKPRASDAKIEQRVQAVLQLKLDGAEPWNVCRYVSEKEQAGEQPWTMDADRKPLCQRTIERYMAAADERISAITLTHEKNALHLAFAQRRGLYARAMADKDFRTALAVLADLARLADLYPAPKKQPIELSGTVIYDRKLTDDERQAAIVNLAARLGSRSVPPAEHGDGKAD